MNPFSPTEHEVRYRHQQVHIGYVAAQRQMTSHGFRQLLGNTIIAMGNRIHGMAQGACGEAAENRGSIRAIVRTATHTVP